MSVPDSWSSREYVNFVGALTAGVGEREAVVRGDRYVWLGGEAGGLASQMITTDTWPALMSAGRASVLSIGAGLEKATGDRYRAEWLLYLSFCSRRGISPVPGRDQPWRIDVVARYLRWRANRNNNRSVAQIKSKLKHCSLCYGHLLPTRANEGPAMLRLQLAMV